MNPQIESEEWRWRLLGSEASAAASEEELAARFRSGDLNPLMTRVQRVGCDAWHWPHTVPSFATALWYCVRSTAFLSLGSMMLSGTLWCFTLALTGAVERSGALRVLGILGCFYLGSSLVAWWLALTTPPGRTKGSREESPKRTPADPARWGAFAHALNHGVELYDVLAHRRRIVRPDGPSGLARLAYVTLVLLGIMIALPQPLTWEVLREVIKTPQSLLVFDMLPRAWRVVLVVFAAPVLVFGLLQGLTWLACKRRVDFSGLGRLSIEMGAVSGAWLALLGIFHKLGLSVFVDHSSAWNLVLPGLLCLPSAIPLTKFLKVRISEDLQYIDVGVLVSSAALAVAAAIARLASP